MADQVLLSEVVFRRVDVDAVVHLKVPGGLKRTPGVSPGVVRALASTTQVGSLLDGKGAVGSLELFDGFRRVALADYRLVDLYPAQLDLNGQPVEWELFFADARRKFSKPLGGELVVGELNRAPVNRFSQTDARGKALVEPEDLIALCLAAMDVVPVGGVPPIPQDRRSHVATDLKWDGAWAPGELEELCKAYGLVVCPTIDGRYAVGVLGDTERPEPPGPAVVTPLPPAGRATDQIVLRSSPRPLLRTLTLRGPAPLGGITDGFEWVMPDEDADGKKIYSRVDEVSWLSNIAGWPAPGTALLALKNPAAVPKKWIGILGTELFRMIRVPTGIFGPLGPPLDEVYQAQDGAVGPPQLLARAAVPDLQTGVYKMQDDAVVPVESVRAGDVNGPVIRLSRQVFKLRDGVTEAAGFAAWREAEMLVEDDCAIALTFEQVDEDGRPKYFSAGFRRTVGGIEAMSDAEVAAAASSVTVSAASLVLISERALDGSEVDNEEDVKADAHAIARVTLGERGDAADVVMPGYWPVELSGAVSSVSYSQNPPETRYTVGGHFRPMSGKAGTGGAASVGHTPSRSTDQARVSSGAASASPKSRVIGDSVSQPTGGAATGTFVQLDSREVGREKYRGSIISLKDTSSPSTNAFADLGPSPGESVLLVNIGGRSIGPTHTLALESIVGPVTFIGSIDTPPAEGSPEGTPRDRRRVCYIATDWTPFRQFRTREQGDNLILEGSHAAQPLEDSDWETILTFDLCPPPEGA